MAETVKMTRGDQEALERWYWHKEELEHDTDPTYGVAILIPSGDIQDIAYDLDDDGAEGYLEVTVYSEAEIEADTAVWRTLPEGASINRAVSAVRQVNVSGTTTLFVRAQ